MIRATCFNLSFSICIRFICFRKVIHSCSIEERLSFSRKEPDCLLWRTQRSNDEGVHSSSSIHPFLSFPFLVNCTLCFLHSAVNVRRSRLIRLAPHWISSYVSLTLIFLSRFLLTIHISQELHRNAKQDSYQAEHAQGCKRKMDS